MEDSRASKGLLSRFIDWRSLVPIANWLPKYEKKFLTYDLIAGITLASFVLPESMAYATLAGLPVEAGIYCCLAGGLFFAFFTTAKQVAVGPTSAISLMVGTTVATLSGGDLSKWIAIAELTALSVAVICVLAFIFKLSSLVSFISESILLGFKAGAALSIASTQLPQNFWRERRRNKFLRTHRNAHSAFTGNKLDHISFRNGRACPVTPRR